MLKSILERIPIIGTLCFFPLRIHSLAWRKFLFSIVCSMSPVLFALLFSSLDKEGDFWNHIWSSFSIGEQYVYAATFLTPLFYLIYERFQGRDGDENFSSKISHSIKDLFPGYGLTIMIASIVLLITGAAFSVSKIESPEIEDMLIFSLSPYLAPAFFIFSMYCFYISILDHYYDGSDALYRNKEKQENMADKFKNRLREE